MVKIIKEVKGGTAILNVCSDRAVIQPKKKPDKQSSKEVDPNVVELSMSKSETMKINI